MRLKAVVKDYFTFSRKDRIGILALLGLVLVIYFLPKIFKKDSDFIPILEDTSITNSIDSLQRKNTTYNKQNETDQDFQYQYEPTQTGGYTAGDLFSFDPNTLSPEGWKRLGLNDRTIKTLLNYRNKGGRFYKAEDLKKIWGMPEGFYERVSSYIRITSTQQDNKTFQPNYSPGTPYEKRERKVVVVNVNEADTSAFIALPGIGSKLANRITNFRDKLGGFYSVDQIRETYGLPDSTFQKIKQYLNVDPGQIKKININNAAKDELRSHPYINWNLANAIVEYRNQHGRFSSIEELKKIMLMDEATLNKIYHYLTLN